MKGYHGKFLEVDLNNPILPGEKATFEMIFEGQVPVQIRRSGRKNKEGVELSMSQWYPKLIEILRTRLGSQVYLCDILFFLRMLLSS